VKARIIAAIWLELGSQNGPLVGLVRPNRRESRELAATFSQLSETPAISKGCALFASPWACC